MLFQWRNLQGQDLWWVFGVSLVGRRICFRLESFSVLSDLSCGRSERALNSLSKLMWCFAKFYLICFFHKFEESILTTINSFIVKQPSFWTNQIPKDNFHGEKTWKRLSCLQDMDWSSFRSMKLECKALQGAIKERNAKKKIQKKIYPKHLSMNYNKRKE